MQDFRAAIDWSRPWLAPFRTGASCLLAAADWRAAANEAAAVLELRNHRGFAIRFVPQEALPPGTAYEAFISSTGQVPSRDNLHDFFNALMWLHFPRTKVRLNALQAAEIDRNGGVAGTRGKVRDAATIFDENTAIVTYHDPAFAVALRAHNWIEVFMKRHAGLGRNWEVCLFGHALLEKLVKPYKAATAHAWLVPVGEEFFLRPDEDKRKHIDEAIERTFADGFTTAAFTPLPIAGVPGWWAGQDAAFYADATVFRPARRIESVG